MSNRLSRRDLVAESFGVGLDELYEYDLINRLKELDRGTLNSAANSITGKTFAQCWSLDTTGNWSGFREDDNGDGIWDLVQSRSANPVNEITGITNAVGSAWVQPKYDAVGNMTTVPQPGDPTKAYTCQYDAWNRLVKVVDASTGDTVAQYAYDGAKRRTVKNTYTAGVLSETRHFFYTDPQNWQVVEERVGISSSAERQFIWGLRYIDDLLVRDRDTTGSGTFNERLYGLQDPNWNMVAIVSAAAFVQERYSYDAYGTVTILTSSFALRSTSPFKWETFFGGYRLDHEIVLLHVRERTLHANFGWLQRDPVSDSAAAADLLVPQSLYAYCDLNPIVATDPLGEQLVIPPTVVPLTGRCCDWEAVACCIWESANFITPGPNLFDCWAFCAFCKAAPTPLTCAPCAACLGGFAALCLAQSCRPASKVPCTFTRFTYSSGYYFPFRPGIRCYYSCPDGSTQTVTTTITMTSDFGRSHPYRPKAKCSSLTPSVYMC